MTETRYDAAVRYLKTPFETLLPKKRQGELQTWAHDACDRISRYSREGGPYSGLATRVEAFFFPFIAGASVLQKTGTTATAFTNKLLNHLHEDESPSQELKELALAIGTMFYSILAWLPSIIDPSILTRPEREERLPTDRELEINRLRGESAEKDQRIQENAQRAAAAERNALWNVLPAINCSNLERVNGLLQACGFDSITVKTAEGPTKEQQDAIDQVFWGVEENDGRFYFDYERTTCPTIYANDPGPLARDANYAILKREIKDLEFVIRPKGVLTLEIDCQEITPENLLKLLNMSHNIGELVLKRPNLQQLLTLDQRDSALAQIHTLTIQDDRAAAQKETFAVDDLYAIADRFPRIACFDLRGCKFSGVPDRLTDSHVLLYSTFERGVRFVGGAESTQHNNILDQLNSFNRRVFEMVNLHKPHSIETTTANTVRPVKLTTHFNALLKVPGQHERFHPFDFCATRLSCFRGTTFRTKDLKMVFERLMYNFPNLHLLDLSFCPLLDSDTFDHLSHCPVKIIYLKGCDAVLAAYRENGPQKNPGTFYQANSRWYELDLQNVSLSMLRLYQDGTDTIVLSGSILNTLEHPSREHRTYEEYVKAIFAKSLHVQMDKLCRPPSERDLLVFYTGVGHRPNH